LDSGVELAAAIGAMQQSIALASTLDRHNQRISDERRCHRRTHRPADHTSRERIDDDSHIAMESFFSSLKTERTARKTYGTRYEAKRRTGWDRAGIVDDEPRDGLPCGGIELYPGRDLEPVAA
jgi:hypothetical protein